MLRNFLPIMFGVIFVAVSCGKGGSRDVPVRSEENSGFPGRGIFKLRSMTQEFTTPGELDCTGRCY